MKLKKLATIAVLSTLALSAAATAVSADALSDAQAKYDNLQRQYAKLAAERDALTPSGNGHVSFEILSKTEELDQKLAALNLQVKAAREKVEELRKKPTTPTKPSSTSSSSSSKTSSSSSRTSSSSSKTSTSSSSSTSSTSGIATPPSTAPTAEDLPTLKTTRFVIKNTDTMIADPELDYQPYKPIITYQGETYKYESTTEKDDIRTHHYVLEGTTPPTTPKPKPSNPKQTNDKKPTRVGISDKAPGNKVLPKTSSVK